MNSFQDLNNYSNQLITYNDGSSYSLVFGNALGNGTVTSNVNVYHSLQDRQPLITFTGSTQPIIVNIQSPEDSQGACLANVVYVGNSGNLSVTTINSGTWCIGNVWSVADYNEVFANTLAYIDSLRTQDFSYTTNITDQQGNNRSFYTNVDVVPFGFSYPSTVTFNEDANAIIDGMLISDLANDSYSVTMSLANSSVGTLVLNSNARTGNTQVISGTKANVNTVLSGNIVYVPADDYVSNSNIALTVLNTTTSNTVVSGNIQLQIGTTHADFSYPTQLNYGLYANTNIGTTSFGNLRITDLAVGKNYSVSAAMANISAGNLYIGSTNYSNLVTLTGNSTAVNSNLANLVIVPNGTGGSNTTIIYTQTQTTANIAQGNVTMPVTWTPTTWHISYGAERATGTINGTIPPTLSAGSDFWRGQYYANGYPYLTAPAISTMRETSITKSGSVALRIGNSQGFVSRADTTSPFPTASEQTIEFWIYPTTSLGNCTIARFSQGTAESWTAEPGLNFGTVDNEMFLWPDPYTFVKEYAGSDRWNQRAVLGTLTANTWTHIAFQRNDQGNTASSLSCWVNGQPKTEKYSIGSASNSWFGSPTSPYGSAWLDDPVRYVFIGGNLPPPVNLIPQPSITGLQAIIDNFSITNQAMYTPGVSFTPSTQPAQPGGNVRQIINGL